MTYPTIADLRRKAKTRIPHFVWEYLDSATGSETVLTRNRTALDQITFDPGILKGPIEPDLTTEFLGRSYALPLGIAPVGMSGLIWPGAEQILARTAQTARIPYALSTVATRVPEEIGPQAGDMGWFQLYPPKSADIRRDILRRARDSGFETLVVTVDVPAPSRRERQRRAGLSLPPKLTPAILAQIALRPAWALGTLRNGTPRLRLPEDYVSETSSKDSLSHAGYIVRGSPDWDYFVTLRSEWDGPMIVKGVMNPDDAAPLVAEGADALWVSNHSGRQFDGAQAAINVLPEVRKRVPDTPLIYDSGIAGGLDILRALAKGADFVMLGRAFHYAVAALGADGPAHLANLLRDDMVSNLGQIGTTDRSTLDRHLTTQNYDLSKLQ